MTNIIDLTSQLVSIPSWVDDQINESKIGEFIFEFLKKNPQLTVLKQTVTDNRFNILASNSQDIKTLIIGHIDTVGVGGDWESDPIIPVISNGKLFGRGTTDMKSGLAAMLLLADKLPPNTGLLCYIDEEYNFLGIKDFISRYQNQFSPQTIISLDGSELEISNGCRGLIEIDLNIAGVSCHAATPQYGRNAIEIGYQIYLGLTEYLQKYSDPLLGPTTINLGKINGGTAPNVVPGSCRLVFDIRPSTTTLNAKMVEAQIRQLAQRYLGQIISLQTNFDFGCWLTPRSDIKTSLPFKDIANSGYIDIALLWEAFNQPTCLTFGAGAQSMAHKANEYIEVDKLNQLENFLFELITNVTIKP
jgi:acetylornithine deacetylase/succinyl-diaminopimelate desuccinylase-like protein